MLDPADVAVFGMKRRGGLTVSEQVPAPRTCGRPTRSGSPCKNQINRFDFACGTHATEHDRELTKFYAQGYQEGYQRGRESGESGAKSKVEWLERRVNDLEQRLDGATRIYEKDGCQVVTVGKYAYRWSGQPPLEVGDRILLPANWLSELKSGPGPQVGVVTQLGTTYDGPLSRIIGRAPTDQT